MKKKISMLFLIVISFFTVINAQASTNTIPRTEDDLKVPSGITVTEENKSFILNTPKVDAREKIYDFAEILTIEEEEQLFSLVTDYIAESSMDLAIVTINENPKSYYNGQNSTAVYADDFYDYNDFKKDGVLFLIDLENREYYVSTTGQGILVYDDDRIDQVLDNAEDSMRNGNYFEASKEVIKTLKDFYQSGIPESNANCEITYSGAYKCYKKVPYFPVILITAIITIITFTIIINSYKKIRSALNASRYISKGKTKIDKRVDLFYNTYTHRERIMSDSDGGSSIGSSGGSSTHSSSSGSSHGGGGRGF